MTAEDLSRWDVSLIEHKLLKPASLDAFMDPVRLKNGAPTSYALGVGVSDADGHPKLQHGGAVSGFVSQNTVWPDQKAAVVVLANMDGSSAPGSITNQIALLLLAEAEDPQAAQQLEQARRIFSSLQEGRIDRALLNSDADAYFTPQVLRDAAASLKPLGVPESFQTDFRRAARRHDLPSLSDPLQGPVAALEHIHNGGWKAGAVFDSVARYRLSAMTCCPR